LEKKKDYEKEPPRRVGGVFQFPVFSARIPEPFFHIRTGRNRKPYESDPVIFPPIPPQYSEENYKREFF